MPDVIPKGKAAKEQATADYRATLLAVVRKHMPMTSTLGGNRLLLVYGDVRLNGMVVTDPEAEVKPGDKVSVLRDDGRWSDSVVISARMIEETW